MAQMQALEKKNKKSGGWSGYQGEHKSSMSHQKEKDHATGV